jgi:hypothetical protein
MTTLPIADLRSQYHHLKNIVNEAELFMTKLNAYALAGDLIPNATDALLQIKTQLQPQIDVLASEIDYRANYYKKYQRLCSFKIMDDLPDKIQSVKSRINQAQAVIAKKRKPLIDDGVGEDIAALTYPDYDSTADLVKLGELQYQLDAWIGFQNYQHPDFLPISEVDAAKSWLVKKQY